MTDFSKCLHRLPLHARGAVEETTGYYFRQALPEVSAETTAEELRAVLTKIRRSFECQALLAELPSEERQLVAELPHIAVDLAHSRLRRGEVELASNNLPDHECFRHRDQVWIPYQSGHDLSGHTGSFRCYTDPRIGHLQRQARIRLVGGEEEALVPPESLAFAPDPEAFEEFRELKEYRIEDETPKEQRQGRRFHPACVLTYTLSYQPRRVTLAAGQGDDLNVFSDGLHVFVLATNDVLRYVGVEIFDAEGAGQDEFFFQEELVEENLGQDFWELEAQEMLERIASGYVPSPKAPRFEDYEHLRTWNHDGFRLELYDTWETDRHGKSHLAYELFDEEFGAEPVFSGNSFHASPLHTIDSDATVAEVLSFLSLQSGDTDDEYFDGYTPEQLAWRDQRAEDLGLIVFHLEERQRWRELHLAGSTEEAVLAVAEYGTVEDLFEVLDMDVFQASEVVEPLARRDSRLLGLEMELLRVRNREVVAL